jgi:site-specific DNA recombinase
VQARLKEGLVERRLRQSRSPAILVGRIFDDRGNPMSPSHANKQGIRYRYYVSRALLENRKSDIGCVPRVSAPEVEDLVSKAIREVATIDSTISDRELIERTW